ncbi:twin transmembrane helix small protein [soil metagenome]
MARRPGRCYVAIMSSFLSTIALPIALAVVTIVLMLGLFNMMRGGSPNTSQKLMRLRVLFQFIAIVIAMLAVWALGKS